MLANKWKGLKSSAFYILLHGQAVGNTAGKRHLVCIFQLTSKGDAPGDRGDLAGQRGHSFLDIINGGIPLYVGVEREQQFGGPFFFHALQERFDMELCGPDAIQRGNDTAQYVVGAVVLLGAFDGDHIPDILHYADQVLVAERIGTGAADIAIADIVTALAEFDVFPQARDRFAELRHLGQVLFQQVQHQPQGGLPANPRQPGEFRHRIFKKRRRELHLQKYELNAHGEL